MRVRFKGLEPSIADYHRSINKISTCSLCYSAVRNRLKKLEEQGFLRSKLVKGFVKNDLADSEGVKVKRFTKVYKKIYAINVRNEVLKRLILAMHKVLSYFPEECFVMEGYMSLRVVF